MMEDDNKSPSTSYTSLRPKKLRSFDEMDGALWDCSVCTYKNNAEAFKCAICDTRKGTSTRKPKVNSQLVAQQTAQQSLPTPAKVQKISNPKRIIPSNKRSNFSQSRIKNFDQNSEQQMEVTVGDVTVIITDYKLLPIKDEKTPPESPYQLDSTTARTTTTYTMATPTVVKTSSTAVEILQSNCITTTATDAKNSEEEENTNDVTCSSDNNKNGESSLHAP